MTGQQGMKMIVMSASQMAQASAGGKPITITVPGQQGGPPKTVTIQGKPGVSINCMMFSNRLRCRSMIRLSHFFVFFFPAWRSTAEIQNGTKS